MQDRSKRYWEMRLKRCGEALEANGFEVFCAESPAHAGTIILERILPHIRARTVSWGDSMTLHETGVLEVLKNDPAYSVLETFSDRVPRAEILERRRQALLVDLFLTGTNAVTETGMLANLDMIGNRVAAVAFGPRHVVLTAGRNKIVPDLDAAVARIRNYAAPANAIRHPGFKTPCVRTSRCTDCKSPDRICNCWSITEKSFPRGRVKVVLINRSLGL